MAWACDSFCQRENHKPLCRFNLTLHSHLAKGEGTKPDAIFFFQVDMVCSTCLFPEDQVNRLANVNYKLKHEL